MSELLSHLISRAAQNAPDAEALVYRNVRLSYAEVQASISHTASGLHTLGLVAGERVAIYLPKQVEAVQAIFATASVGGIFVPINPLLKPPQVAHIVADCEASVLVTSADRAKLLMDILPGCPSLRHLVITDGELETDHFPQLTLINWAALQSAQEATQHAIPADISGDSLAAILYTSGSTGNPKGVVLSHRNLVLGAQSVAMYLDMQPADRVLAVLPLSFDYGLSQLTTAFHTGATVVLINYLLPREVLRTVERERISTLAGVPSLWVQVAALDWPEDAARCLRTITNSGGHLPAPLIEKLQTQLPTTALFLMYGLTEAFRSSYLPPAELATHPGSMGKAIPHTELAVVRPDGSACAPDEAGELVHAGPLVAQGYWNNPEKTAQHFRPPPAAMAHRNLDERVVWSGDTVTMDADGYLYFVGREDDMIKTSGYRVSPSEVEEVVYASGLVHEVAVIGVPHPALGQAIVAIVTSGTNNDDAEISRQILIHCKKTLPGFMLPQHLEIKNQLAKNPNGKIDRQSLKQAFQQHFAEPQ